MNFVVKEVLALYRLYVCKIISDWLTSVSAIVPGGPRQPCALQTLVERCWFPSRPSLSRRSVAPTLAAPVQLPRIVSRGAYTIPLAGPPRWQALVHQHIRRGRRAFTHCSSVASLRLRLGAPLPGSPGGAARPLAPCDAHILQQDSATVALQRTAHHKRVNTQRQAKVRGNGAHLTLDRPIGRGGACSDPSSGLLGRRLVARRKRKSKRLAVTSPV
jgi:hypothetical protein